MSVIQRPESTSVSGRNIGPGVSIYERNESGTGIFHSISAGGGITIAKSGSGIEISSITSSGEANTVSNTGTGTGIFRQKIGVNFEFKSLSASPTISINGETEVVTISANLGGVESGTALNSSQITTLNATYEKYFLLMGG